MVKLVNYIRGEVLAGNGPPDITTSTAFQDDRYLQPTLEDDPLLYSLHDIIGEELDIGAAGSLNEKQEAMSQTGKVEGNHIRELEEQLRLSREEVEARTQQLEALKSKFEALGDPEPSLDGRQKVALDAGNRLSQNVAAFGDTDSSYFASYSGHGK